MVPSETLLVAVLVLAVPGLCADTELRRVARSARRNLSQYRAYNDVNVLPYSVPERTRLAVFNFTSEVEIVNGLGTCSPHNVTIDLRPGSFPVISPDGALFPDNFQPVLSSPWYGSTALSDGRPFTVNVSVPMSGDWYAIAFISFTDPDDEKITQQGLTPTCTTLLESTLDVIQAGAEDITVLAFDKPLTEVQEVSANISVVREYSIYVPAATWDVSLNVTVEQCQTDCPSFTLAVRASALPTLEDTGDNSTLVNVCSSEDIVAAEDCFLKFPPWEETWHYISVTIELPKSSKRNATVVTFTVEVSAVRAAISPLYRSSNATNETALRPEPVAVIESDQCPSCWPQVPLMKQSYPPFFMFSYVMLPGADGKTPHSVNISTATPTVAAMAVKPVSEVGGTLTALVRLELDSRIKNATERGVNVSVAVCFSHGTRAEPVLFAKECLVEGFSAGIMAALELNSTTAEAAVAKVHVPYPAPGAWYLSIRPFCWAAVNDSVEQVACAGLPEVSVSFIIHSESCGPEMCGDFGVCNNYLSGGVIFSSCACSHGYRGWGCTDGSAMTPLGELLAAALLLTLSNLFFAPAVFVACRHRYWTEALVYAATMFFSTFYHACEAGEDVYSWCMMPISVLQFCDFYTAILSVWVTLVAMANINTVLRSLCHVAGAIGIALGTEYDRTSLTVFLMPVLFGLAILGAAWGARCRRRRACYPSASYWRWRAPPALLLVCIGLVCFAFLQTRQNYKYVHSAWHAVMALAIIFLLPHKSPSRSGGRQLELGTDTPEEDLSVDRRPFWKAKVRGWRKRSL